MRSPDTARCAVAANSVRNIVRQMVSLLNRPDRMTAPPNRYPCIQPNNCKREMVSWKCWHKCTQTRSIRMMNDYIYTHDGISPTAAPLYEHERSMQKMDEKRENVEAKNAWANLKFKFLIKFLSLPPPLLPSPRRRFRFGYSLASLHHGQWPEPLFIAFMQMKMVKKQTLELRI